LLSLLLLLARLLGCLDVRHRWVIKLWSVRLLLALLLGSGSYPATSLQVLGHAVADFLCPLIVLRVQAAQGEGAAEQVAQIRGSGGVAIVHRGDGLIDLVCLGLDLLDSIDHDVAGTLGVLGPVVLKESDERLV
jgi:hypothetical protein